jgi:hypothetical protein
MVYKVLAVLRTAFLAFILFYTIKNTPILFGLPSDINEPYKICKESYEMLKSATWLAIAWIVFETAVGWFLATRGAKLPAKPAAVPAPPPGAP